jgi:RNA polymerase sigma-70 factor (ECF subfamily)
MDRKAEDAVENVSRPYQQLVTEHQSDLFGFICYLLGGSEDAWDVLQETNVVLWEKAREFDASRKFAPWAFQVARYQVLAYRERHHRDRHFFSDGVINALAEELRGSHVHSDVRLSALEACIDQLAGLHRQMVERRYKYGESVAEIATHLGRSANAVAAALYRLRRSLAECIELKTRSELHQ